MILALCLLCWVGTTSAQDVILKKDNTTVLSKVLEVTNTEIKYKKWSNLDGPTYSISCSEITSINYQNGDVEKFTNNAATASTPQPTTSVPILNPKETVETRGQESQEPQMPYSRRRVQFSLNGGIAFPRSQFGRIDEEYFCAPFSLYGDELETRCGSAKTGFLVSAKLHIPVYKKDKDIIGIPLKFNLLYNGIADEEKKDFRTYYLDAVSSSMNEFYGVNAYSYRALEYPNYMNFSIMPGIDYTHYFSTMFALFAEANMGLNIAHITNLILYNELGDTYVYYDSNTNTNYYSEEKDVFSYKTRINFAYEFGAGIYVLNHMSLGVFYTGYTPFSVSSTRTYTGKMGDNIVEECSGPKLQVSALSIQLGFHF